ncbi:DUF536 domain-containing protein [Staphylococcus hominis]|uniref:DUF536 domain-containing protein n=1 Tax=Staphylococcus hominis TaxID=1290 RepID=UPI003F49174B
MKINELEKQIEYLKARSEKDNTYIETLTEQLNQQILALESNKKIQRLESELEEEKQINYSSSKPMKMDSDLIWKQLKRSSRIVKVNLFRQIQIM